MHGTNEGRKLLYHSLYGLRTLVHLLASLALRPPLAVFDKIEGTDPAERERIVSQHPLTLTNALSDETLDEVKKVLDLEKLKDPRIISWIDCNRPDDLFEVFEAVIEDYSKILADVLEEDHASLLDQIKATKMSPTDSSTSSSTSSSSTSSPYSSTSPVTSEDFITVD